LPSTRAIAAPIEVPANGISNSGAISQLIIGV
jgi:hypothetical protein